MGDPARSRTETPFAFLKDFIHGEDLRQHFHCDPLGRQTFWHSLWRSFSAGREIVQAKDNKCLQAVLHGWRQCQGLAPANSRFSPLMVPVYVEVKMFQHLGYRPLAGGTPLSCLSDIPCFTVCKAFCKSSRSESIQSVSSCRWLQVE